MPRLRRLLGDDQVAQLDAFVADVDARSGHELGYGVLVLVAEGAAQGGQPGRARGEIPGAPSWRQGQLDGMVPGVDYAAR